MERQHRDPRHRDDEVDRSDPGRLGLEQIERRQAKDHEPNEDQGARHDGGEDKSAGTKFPKRSGI